MPFPAARERHIGARDLLGHHPEREHVAGVWSKSVTAVLFGNYGREQSRLKQIVEVFGRKGCGPIVFSRARSKLLTREHADAIDQILLLSTQVELVFQIGGDHCF